MQLLGEIAAHILSEENLVLLVSAKNMGIRPSLIIEMGICFKV